MMDKQRLQQQAVYAAGIHQNPMGRWAGKLFFSAPLSSPDPTASFNRQLADTFVALDQLLADQQLDNTSLAQCFIWIEDWNNLSLLEQQWRQQFPDPVHCPARQIGHTTFNDGRKISIECIALADSERHCLSEIPGVGRRHSDCSAPLAVIMGDILFAPAINGIPPNGNLPNDPGAQADQAFENLKTMMGHCDFALEDAAHLFAWQRDHSLRQRINDPWEQTFPDKFQRPARHALQLAHSDYAVQFSLIAVRNSQQRHHLNLTQLGAITHTAQRSPGFLPISVSRGDMLFSAANFGADRETGDFIEDIEQQVKSAFEHSLEIIKLHGFALTDVVHAYIWHKGDEYRQFLDPLWEQTFADASTRPVRHDVEAPLPLVLKMQIELIAVRDSAQTAKFVLAKHDDIEVG